MTGNSFQPTVHNRIELPKGVPLDGDGFPILSNLEIVRRLGAGGFGTCYLANQQPLDRHVAVKVLRSELSNDSQFIERFKREMKILAGFQHPNIVQIFTASDEPPLYYVMEFIGNVKNESRTLAHLLEEKGKLDEATVQRLSLQMTNALHSAHLKGIIHRDIKPQNILLTNNGQAVKVCDFGIARVKSAKESSESHQSMTRTGSPMGTLDYMAPEQIADAKNADERSDVYSLGAVLYRMLTGRKAKERSRSTFRKRCPDVSGAWEDLIEEMLEPDREDRPQAMKTVFERLQTIDQSARQPEVVKPLSRNDGKEYELELARIQREKELLAAEESRLLKAHQDRLAKEEAEKVEQEKLVAEQQKLEEQKLRVEALKRGELPSPTPSIIKPVTDYRSPFEDIFEALSKGSLEDVKYFLGIDNINVKGSRGADMFVAAESNSNVEVLKYLVSIGADVNVKYPAISGFNPDLADATPLHFAAHHNSEVAVVQFLIDQGADVNAKTGRGATPLHFAANHNSEVGVLQFLIDKGADTNTKDNFGDTLLHVAAWKNKEVAVLQFLIDKEADVSAKNMFGITPLHLAASYNSNDAVLQFLIDQGADVNAKNSYDENTPLHNAALTNSNVEVLKCLVSAGGDVNAKDKEVNAPLDVANTEEKKRILRAAGGKSGKEL